MLILSMIILIYVFAEKIISVRAAKKSCGH